MSFIRLTLRLSILGLLAAIWLLAGVYLFLSPNLPDVETLRDVKLQTPMRVYTREGDLIGQFGEQKRTPLSFEEIPTQFVNALLSAEDDNFFNHRGVDVMGLLRAVSELVMTGEKGSGGSTLTMQVARNYFLTLDRTFLRKFNEILLAIEIERSLSKQEIFELYSNRIFLGHRSYGFEAAAQVYYGKSLGDLNLAQHAMLAGIPKAPSRNNPLSNLRAGEQRRNWILGRMLELGYIERAEYESALSFNDPAQHHGAPISATAAYAAEMARQQMLDRYGMSAYSNGYHVYTTINSELQQAALKAVISGLIAYDKRHGYRGPERRFAPTPSLADTLVLWKDALAGTPVIAGLRPAIVTSVEETRATLLLADGSTPDLLWEHGISTARPYRSENSTGGNPRSVAEVLDVGDLIRVTLNEEDAWQLAQLPNAQAALVSLNPNDGAIVSVVGGMGFDQSKFNRATQAERQPGSNFKPFLYSAALDAGYTAASMVNDAPVVLEDSTLEDIWRPENDSGEFYGPTRLRWALTKSRNLVSIRLLQQLGVSTLISYLERLGFDTADIPRDLTLALGSNAMTPMEVATGYAILANGGYRVEPYLIARIDNLAGETVYEARPPTVCQNCELPMRAPVAEELSMSDILAGDAAQDENLPLATRVMEPRVHFVIDSILKDVITRGTGTRALELKRRDLAGKTGTTNGPMDSWFSGYNPAVVTTTWVGFDNYTPLGRKEFGGTAALPIWIDYMREALRDTPEIERALPEGIVHVKIDPDTGQLASPGQPDAIFEYFREDQVPQQGSWATGGQNGGPNAEELIRDIF